MKDFSDIGSDENAERLVVDTTRSFADELGLRIIGRTITDVQCDDNILLLILDDRIVLGFKMLAPDCIAVGAKAIAPHD